MHEVHEELLRSAQTEILSEKTSRYKRNVLILSIALSGVHFFDATFTGLNLLGIQLPSDINNKVVAVSLLWLANAYNIAMFWVHGWSDWKKWVDNLTGRWPEQPNDRSLFFPELDMYWEKLPARGDTRRARYGGKKGLFAGWVGYEKDKFSQTLTLISTMKASLPHQGQSDSKQQAFTVPMVLVHTVKREVRNVRIFDVMFPFLAVCLAGLGVAWDISH